MKTYNIIWKTAYVESETPTEMIVQRDFTDVQFKDQYVVAVDDNSPDKDKTYIPYYRIYDIVSIGEDDIEEPYLGH
jgi:hypothetical protein